MAPPIDHEIFQFFDMTWTTPYIPYVLFFSFIVQYHEIFFRLIVSYVSVLFGLTLKIIWNIWNTNSLAGFGRWSGKEKKGKNNKKKKKELIDVVVLLRFVLVRYIENFLTRTDEYNFQKERIQKNLYHRQWGKLLWWS